MNQTVQITEEWYCQEFTSIQKGVCIQTKKYGEMKASHTERRGVKRREKKREEDRGGKKRVWKSGRRNKRGGKGRKGEGEGEGSERGEGEEQKGKGKCEKRVLFVSLDFLNAENWMQTLFETLRDSLC